MRPAVRFGLEAIVQRNGSINAFIPEWIPTPHNQGVIKARRILEVGTLGGSSTWLGCAADAD